MYKYICDVTLVLPIPLAALRGHGCKLLYSANGEQIEDEELVKWIERNMQLHNGSLQYIDVTASTYLTNEKGEQVGIRSQRYFIEEVEGTRRIPLILSKK